MGKEEKKEEFCAVLSRVCIRVTTTTVKIQNCFTTTKGHPFATTQDAFEK